jgi:hypothetical protein
MTLTRSGRASVDMDYHYTPLDHSARELRLVKLLPGDEGIHIAMQIFPLVEAPSFDALSYVWGRPESSVLVQCESATIRVAHNLGAFLEALQRKTNTNYLWVDAISIDQMSISERRYLVSLMPRIYRAAARTLIWTGCEDYGFLNRFIDSTLLIGDFSRVAAEILTVTDIFHSNRKITQQDLRNFHELANKLSCDTQWDTCDTQWGVSTFLERKYFKRHVQF